MSFPTHRQKRSRSKEPKTELHQPGTTGGNANFFATGPQNFGNVATGQTHVTHPIPGVDDERASTLAHSVLPCKGLGIGAQWVFDLPLSPSMVSVQQKAPKAAPRYDPRTDHYEPDSRYLHYLGAPKLQPTTHRPPPPQQQVQGAVSFTGLRPSLHSHRLSAPEAPNLPQPTAPTNAAKAAVAPSEAPSAATNPTPVEPSAPQTSNALGNVLGPLVGDTSSDHNNNEK